MPTYLLRNRGGTPRLTEILAPELQLALASLQRNPGLEVHRRRSFIRLADGQDLVLRTEINPQTEQAAA